jgi:hypothetical protein
MSNEAIECTVKSLQSIYGIVIALAIAEAFKQFVPSPDSDPAKCGIKWSHLPSLLSLLALVVPFYHGMTRWFSVAYYADEILQPYGFWLLVDCVAFTAEAGLFFILARSLPTSLWWRFTLTTVALLGLDILWGVFAWKYRTNLIISWVIVNICTVPVLVGVSVILRKYAAQLPLLASHSVLVVLLVRTTVDYWTGWPFYFPT